MLMVHNWHCVLVMGINVKINIFGTLSLISENVSKKNIATIYYIFIFQNHNAVRDYAFLIKTVPFLEQCTISHFRKFHELKSLSRFHNKYGFCSKPSLRIYQQFKSNINTHFHYYWISQFFVNDKNIFFCVKNQI